MLDELRRNEKKLLCNMRESESEKYRPPRDRWYELKDKRFNGELKQNR